MNEESDATAGSVLQQARRVEGSVRRLFEDSAWAAGHLRQEAARNALDVERLIFAERMMPPEHMEIVRQPGAAHGTDSPQHRG